MTQTRHTPALPSERAGPQPVMAGFKNDPWDFEERKMRMSVSMRLPNAAHESRPRRIREIAPDFTVEDVWVLPARGGAEDFQALLELMVSLDPANSGSLSTSCGISAPPGVFPLRS
jgi:hypothetical protein